MAEQKATNLLAHGSNPPNAAPPPRVAVASHLAAAAAAVDDFIARVHLYFDRVEGGFESPPPFVDGAVSSRCSAAWETPDCLGRAMEAITELLFVVSAYEIETGPIRRGMDGAWLTPHSKWNCDEPWSALCIEVIDAGRGIAEKKAEVQRGFERDSLTFKWASDATIVWALATASWFRRKAAEVNGATDVPDEGVSKGSDEADVEIDECGFRWLRCGRKEYRFTPRQAECLEVMWELSRKGRRSFAASEVLSRIRDGGRSRLSNMFRSKSGPDGMHEAWETLIRPDPDAGQEGWYQFVF